MAKRPNKQKNPLSSSCADGSISEELRSEGSAPCENRVAGRIEKVVFAVLLICAIVLHITVFMHSGGLWRDEVNTLNTSMISTFTEFWDKLQFESFPVLWFLILRTWVELGFGETDLALRALGLIIGIGVLGSLWLAGRKLNIRFPLVSFILIALCPTVFWGDSLRAYGLGILLILLAMAYMWRALLDPVPWKMLVSLITAVLSVQCLYHNSFLLLALCIAGASVGLYLRNWKLFVFPLVVGAISAISVLPYYITVSKARAWGMIIKVPIDLPRIFSVFRQAIDPSGLFISWVWYFLAMFAIVVFIWTLFAPSSNLTREKKALMLFLLISMAVSVVSYVTFIKVLSYPTQVWYYLPLMAILAIIIDKSIDVVCEKHTFCRFIRAASIAVITIFLFMSSWDAAQVRKTNMDIIAAKLESVSMKNDLIVVFSFVYGISFARYYKGKAMWVTLPEIEDHSVHRWDLYKKRMMQNEPVKPVIGRMLQTLKQGNRVWLTGPLTFLRKGEIPGDLAPAPQSPYGWDGYAYHVLWSRKTAFALQQHGQTVSHIPVPASYPVNKFENSPLLVVKGWRP